MTAARAAVLAQLGGREPSRGQPLTDRQEQVLKFVALGWTNERIAAELFVTAPTVATLLRRVLRKLDVPTRAAAVHRGWQLGILSGATAPSR